MAVWDGVGDRSERAGPAAPVGLPERDHRDRLERGQPAEPDRSRGAASQPGARLTARLTPAPPTVTPTAVLPATRGRCDFWGQMHLPGRAPPAAYVVIGHLTTF